MTISASGLAGDRPERVRRTESVQAEPAIALAGLLGVPVPDLAREGLPILWHWLYTLDRPAQVDLGPDGHPAQGGLVVPPRPGTRRMWAGGRVECPNPMRVGELVARESEVVSVVEKSGRSGSLTFITLRHRLGQAGRLVVDELQDIVYRDPFAAGTTDRAVRAAVSEAGEQIQPEGWHVEISPTLLFRFSALTYNAHRIHYDRAFATGHEGYPGLVTHGPLQAIVMAARAILPEGDAVSFDYRLVAPLYDHQGLVARASPGPDGTTIDTAIRDLSGRRTAVGRTSSGPLAMKHMS